MEQAKIRDLLNLWDARVAAWLARHGLVLLRLALGLVFFWFGVLKFFPGLSVAESLAGRTILKLSLGHVSPSASMPILATWECLIGLSLASGRFMRVGLFLLLLQMPGTFLPLVFFPSETWTRLYAPTLEGQYIIKNCVLLGAALVLGATLRGGALIADPQVAQATQKHEKLYSRFRRRFLREP